MNFESWLERKPNLNRFGLIEGIRSKEVLDGWVVCCKVKRIREVSHNPYIIARMSHDARIG